MPPKCSAARGVQGDDVVLHGHVGVQVEPADLGRHRLPGLVRQVGHAHPRPLGREPPRALPPDPAGRPRDDGHLAVQPSDLDRPPPCRGPAQYVLAAALPSASPARSPRSPPSRRLQRSCPRFTVPLACPGGGRSPKEARHGAERSVPRPRPGGHRPPRGPVPVDHPHGPGGGGGLLHHRRGQLRRRRPAPVGALRAGRLPAGGHLDRAAGPAPALGRRLLHLRRPRAAPGRRLPGRLGLRLRRAPGGAPAVPDLRQRGRRHPQPGVRLELRHLVGGVGRGRRRGRVRARLVRGPAEHRRRHDPGAVRDPGVRRPGRHPDRPGGRRQHPVGVRHQVRHRARASSGSRG